MSDEQPITLQFAFEDDPKKTVADPTSTKPEVVPAGTEQNTSCTKCSREIPKGREYCMYCGAVAEGYESDPDAAVFRGPISQTQETLIQRNLNVHFEERRGAIPIDSLLLIGAAPTAWPIALLTEIGMKSEGAFPFWMVHFFSLVGVCFGTGVWYYSTGTAVLSHAILLMVFSAPCFWVLYFRRLGSSDTGYLFGFTRVAVLSIFAGVWISLFGVYQIGEGTSHYYQKFISPTVETLTPFQIITAEPRGYRRVILKDANTRYDQIIYRVEKNGSDVFVGEDPLSEYSPRSEKLESLGIDTESLSPRDVFQVIPVEKSTFRILYARSLDTETETRLADEPGVLERVEAKDYPELSDFIRTRYYGSPYDFFFIYTHISPEEFQDLRGLSPYSQSSKLDALMGVSLVAWFAILVGFTAIGYGIAMMYREARMILA